MKSLAVIPGGVVPSTLMSTEGGTLRRTSLVSHELKIAVVPTPNATEPIAPAWGVCESLPMMRWPGRACDSRILEWQIASEPEGIPMCPRPGSSP